MKITIKNPFLLNPIPKPINFICNISAFSLKTHIYSLYESPPQIVFVIVVVCLIQSFCVALCFHFSSTLCYYFICIVMT